MSRTPDVSVVMSVYNGATGLPATLDSVLQQQDCDFEFIVVDDGSTDGSAAILQRYAASDTRLKIITQDNAGLTQALIRGCEMAQGQVIVRQDADDLSMPGRLRDQFRYLRDHPDVIVVASGIRFLAPLGEWLYDVIPQDAIEVNLDARKFGAPPLVACAFRRDPYLRAGGFRSTFRVAQDMDLWLRLIELGPCRGLPSIHYETKMTLDGITSQRRSEQQQLCALAIECARKRRAGLGDGASLEAYHATPAVKQATKAEYRAAFHYFIASCLRSRDRSAARRYYRLALRDNPLHLRALFRYLLG